MKTKLLISAALAALSAGPALAAEPILTATSAIPAVDELVITAGRRPERADQVGSQITVLDRAEIEAQQTPLVSQILARTPGVGFTRNGGPGGATQVRIRGAETEHTMFLIDGVKLSDPSDVGGGFNSTDLLTGDIARIEVLRGPQSVLWGSQAIGGVVNLITVEPEKPFEAQAEAEVGSFRTAYGRAAVGGAGERVSWRANAAYFTTRGISQFDEALGGRERDGFHDFGASGRVKTLVTDQLSLEARGAFMKSRNEFDGFSTPTFSFGDDPEYGRSKEWLGYAGANLDLFDGRLSNRAGFAYTQTDRRTFDPTVGAGYVSFDAVGKNRRWEYQGTLAVTDGWTAAFGAESERSSMRADSAFSADRVRAKLEGVYLDVRGEPVKGLTLGGGVRRDHHSDFGSNTIAQASAAWSLNDGATVLRASWGQGFKAPSPYQLGSEFGNLALKPEEADSWDAGVQQALWGGRAKLSAAYFHRRTKNQIDFVSCFSPPLAALCTGPAGPRFGFYDNIARTKAEGVELQGDAELGAGFSVAANYTWTKAVNDAPGSFNFGKRLARRPAHHAYGELAYSGPQGLSAAVAVRYVGASFDNAANTFRLKSYVLTDLRASYKLTEQVEVYGRVENLFDERYETSRNYGQPGRGAYAGVRAKF